MSNVSIEDFSKFERECIEHIAHIRKEIPDLESIKNYLDNKEIEEFMKEIERDEFDPEEIEEDIAFRIKYLKSALVDDAQGVDMFVHHLKLSLQSFRRHMDSEGIEMLNKFFEAICELKGSKIQELKVNLESFLPPENTGSEEQKLSSMVETIDQDDHNTETFTDFNLKENRDGFERGKEIFKSCMELFDSSIIYLYMLNEAMNDCLEEDYTDYLATHMKRDLKESENTGIAQVMDKYDSKLRNGYVHGDAKYDPFDNVLIVEEKRYSIKDLESSVKDAVRIAYITSILDSIIRFAYAKLIKKVDGMSLKHPYSGCPNCGNKEFEVVETDTDKTANYCTECGEMWTREWSKPR